MKSHALNMKIYKLYIISIFFLLSLLFSCEKEIDKIGEISGINDTQDIIQINSNITLTIEVKHHYLAVPDCNIFLKKEATQFPGKDTSKYDLSEITNQYGFVQFNSLYYGEYYLYAIGYDNAIADSVEGRKPIVLDSTTVQQVGLNLESDVIVYVTETH